MKRINVQLTGINRYGDDGLIKDGSCAELINAKVKDGSIQPVGKPILIKTFTEGVEPIYIHKCNGYEHIISYFNGNIIFDSEKVGDKFVTKNVVICSLRGVKEVESIGNMLIIATDTSIHYALYINNIYSYLGDKLPEPDVHVSYYQDVKQSESDEYWCDINPSMNVLYEIGTHISLKENEKQQITDSYKGACYKFIQDMSEKGKMIYPVVARYAIRLYDGSYVMHSAPVLIGEAYPLRMQVTKVNNNKTETTVKDFKYKVLAFTGEAMIRYDLSKLSAYSDVISSVDVFVTKPIYINDFDKEIDSAVIEAGGIGVETKLTFETKRRSEGEIIDEIVNSSSFYLIKSIPVGEISKGGLYENLFKDSNMLKNLEQNEALTDDSFSRCQITGHLYSYNSRLHVANIRTTLANPYPVIMYSDTSTPITIYNTEVHIKTDTGLKVVRSQSNGSQSLSPYISYPDSRAVKMIMWTDQGKLELLLKPHPFLNIAYTLNRLKRYSSSDFAGSYTPLPVDSVEVSVNKLKVSEVNNPIFFPSKNTYSVSNRGIVTMMSATAALSEGQFGRFPLYVFTEEGIYALEVGDGVVYSRSHPVTRDCCASPSTVASTDNAVVFATRSGLKMLSGSSVVELSGKIEGYLPSFVDSSPIIKKIAGVAGLNDKLSTSEFIYYLEGANVGYCYEDKEIIVANTNYMYAYIYNIESVEWYKMSVSINRFVNSYPECYALMNDHGLYDMYNSHRTVNDILIITRPIKFGTTAHKRILQSAIRGVIRPSKSNLYYRGESVKFRDELVHIFSNAGFYILGSNDAEHFKLIAGREKIEDRRC